MRSNWVSVASASVIRSRWRWPSASRYRTSRFSGTCSKRALAAATLSAKRRSLMSARMCATSNSTVDGTRAAALTVIGIRYNTGGHPCPPSSPARADEAFAARGAAPSSELIADLQPQHARPQRYLHLDELARRGEQARIRVAEIRAESFDVPLVLRDAEGRVVRRVRRLIVAQPGRRRIEDACSGREAARLVLHVADVLRADRDEHLVGVEAPVVARAHVVFDRRRERGRRTDGAQRVQQRHVLAQGTRPNLCDAAADRRR